MSTLSRLPLNALRVFATVSKNGSMAKAAEELNVQPSAVSMQLKNLSNYVGVPLFEKRDNQIRLTRHGAQLLPAVLAGLTQIDTAVRSLRNHGTKRAFTLSVLPSYLYRWLLPRIPAFEAEHPESRLMLLTSRELVDLSRADVDAAVRLGAGKWRGAKAEKLMDEWLVPACAPALARRTGRLQQGELPANAKLLHGSVDPWSLWTGHDLSPGTPAFVIDDAMALVTAAEAGQGVGLLRWALISSSVAERRLVPIGERIPYRFAYYWVRAANRLAAANQEGQSGEFRLWLKKQSQIA
jgi:DNA-binding transcriptional LysR family regulator